MKKLAAVAVSIGVILVIVGLVLVGIYGRDKIGSGELFAFGAPNLGSAQGGVDKQPDELEGLKEINVNVSAYSVYVLKSDSNVASVKYVDPLEDGVDIKIEYDDGVLSVTQTDNLSHVFWGFNWFNNRRFIAIYLPQTEQFTQAKLSVKAKAGSINISEMTFASVDVETDAGSVKIDNLTADTMSVSTSAGSVNVDDVNTQSITLSTKAGSINIDDIEAQSVTLSSSAGSTKAENVDCATFNASADAGSITATSINAATSVGIEVSAGSAKCEVDTAKLVINSGAGSITFNANASVIELSSSAGSITGTVKGSKSEYQIEVKQGMGTTDLSSQVVPGATKSLKVKSDIGSIKIKFSNN